MGLRERNAELTREHVIEVALELFFTQGYEQTTMEQIAERADVGSTTLYRYFPTKDLLLLYQLTAFDWGEALKLRPADESIELSLSALLRETIELIASRPETERLRELIDEVPVARARLWDIAARERAGLERALAARSGLSEPDLSITMTARIMYQVYEIVLDRWVAGDHDSSPSRYLDDVLTELGVAGFILPLPLDVDTVITRS